jgi:hypothetical protein
MPTSRIDLFAGLSYIAGGSLTVVASLIGDAAPGHAKEVLAVCGAVTFTAGLLLRLFKNPSPPAGQVSVNAPADTTLTLPLTTQPEAKL